MDSRSRTDYWYTIIDSKLRLYMNETLPIDAGENNTESVPIVNSLGGAVHRVWNILMLFYMTIPLLGLFLSKLMILGLVSLAVVLIAGTDILFQRYLAAGENRSRKLALRDPSAAIFGLWLLFLVSPKPIAIAVSFMMVIAYPLTELLFEWYQGRTRYLDSTIEKLLCFMALAGIMLLSIGGVADLPYGYLCLSGIFAILVGGHVYVGHKRIGISHLIVMPFLMGGVMIGFAVLMGISLS